LKNDYFVFCEKIYLIYKRKELGIIIVNILDRNCIFEEERKIII